jgi:hypothetical protein
MPKPLSYHIPQPRIFKNYLPDNNGRPQIFFPGEGKNFPGGQEPTFCLKNDKKILFFPNKSLKTYYFWQALAGQRGKAPLVPPPADAHAENLLKFRKIKSWTAKVQFLPILQIKTKKSANIQQPIELF